MTKQEKKKESYIKNIWGRTEKFWDNIKKDRAFIILRNQAETDLLEIQNEILIIETKIERNILDSIKEKNWKSIRLLVLERDVKKKELESAVKLYEELFGKSADEFLTID